MKITQLTPNYKSHNVKPEIQKQVASNNINVDEKQIFKFLSANAIAFRGEIEQQETAKSINSKLIDVIERCKVKAYNYEQDNDAQREFSELINNPNFDFNYKTDEKTINDRLNELIYDDESANHLTLGYFKGKLYRQIILNSDNPPAYVTESLNNPVTRKEFLIYFNNDSEFNDEFIDINKTQKLIQKLKKDYAFTPQERLKFLLENSRFIRCRKSLINLIIKEGTNIFTKKGKTTHASSFYYENYQNEKMFPSDTVAISMALDSGISDKEFIQELIYDSASLDDIEDGKSIETLVNEKIKDENIKSQILNSVQLIRDKSRATNNSANDEKLLGLVNLRAKDDVEDFLKSNPTVNINARDKEGNTAAFIAFNNNDYKTFYKLIQHPDIDLNSADIFGDTLAMQISKSGNNLIFLDEMFLDKLKNPKNFNPNYINYITATPTTMLTVAKDANTVKDLLDIKGLDVNLKTPTMNPALIQYIYDEDWEKFKALAQYPGTDLNITSIDGKSIQEVIENVTYDYKTLFDFTNAFREAKNEQTLTKFKILINKFNSNTPEVLSSYLDYPDIKEIINSPINEYNETVPHLLTEYKVIDENKEEMKNLFEKLMKAEPDLDKQDRFGLTPLMKAVNAQNLFAIEFLLKNGADKDIENKGGESAADMANASNNEKLKQIFNEN